MNTRRSRRLPLAPARRAAAAGDPARGVGALERYVAEILDALGMDLDTPGTRETPAAVPAGAYDATAGYDGDPKLLTAFPAERPARVRDAPGQIVEGPIAFSALCEHHALPFHGVAHVALRRRRGDHRHLEADAARPALRTPVHGAGAARRADRRHAGAT